MPDQQITMNDTIVKLNQQTLQNSYQSSQTVILQKGNLPPDTLKNLQQQGDLILNARQLFIKKVYMILTCQLLITIMMCFISYYKQGFRQFQLNNPWLLYFSIGLGMVTEVIIMYREEGRQHPKNIILLLIFTFAQSYTVSFICSLVVAMDRGAIVLTAACMTFIVTICLTFYAILTPYNYTSTYAAIIALVVPFILLGVFAGIGWIPILEVLYCALGCIVYGFYIIIDTEMLYGSDRYSFSLSMDDYVVAALLLYIDIIQFFIFLMALLGINILYTLFQVWFYLYISLLGKFKK